jgi:hypothetical protein
MAQAGDAHRAVLAVARNGDGRRRRGGERADGVATAAQASRGCVRAARGPADAQSAPAPAGA